MADHDAESLTVSVVVVAFDMARELPRTLRSLSVPYQRDIRAESLELVVVDNGSPAPVDPELLAGHPGPVRTDRIDPAPPSPVQAANRGLELASGDLIGLVVDGARIASPGLVAAARLATRLSPRPVISAPAWHLGPVPHMRAAEAGYDQTTEDELLATCDWESDGYHLFTVSTLAGSSGRGMFAPMGESSSLFLPRALWAEIGGLDARFTMPGGGLANHDLYRRACDLPDSELIVLVGEGTFHQYHGGAATSRQFTWDDMHAEYESIRGERHRPPSRSPLLLGRVRPDLLPHVARSVELAEAFEARRRRRRP